MNGDIDELIDSLIAADQAAKLANHFLLLSFLFPSDSGSLQDWM